MCASDSIRVISRTQNGQTSEIAYTRSMVITNFSICLLKLRDSEPQILRSLLSHGLSYLMNWDARGQKNMEAVICWLADASHSCFISFICPLRESLTSQPVTRIVYPRFANALASFLAVSRNVSLTFPTICLPFNHFLRLLAYIMNNSNFLVLLLMLLFRPKDCGTFSTNPNPMTRADSLNRLF